MDIRTITAIIYCITGGITLGFILSLITRLFVGPFVSSILNSDAKDEDSAKTLEELKVKRGVLLSLFIKNSSTLKRIVSSDSEKEPLSKRRFWIAEEYTKKAKSLYGTEKISLLSILIFALLLALVVLLCTRILPMIEI